MKNIFTLLFILLISTVVFSQDNRVYRQKTVEGGVPKIVSAKFKEKYPNALIKGWYITHITYWQNDVSAGWYTNWYGTRAIVVYQYSKPTYYEVEFTGYPGELSRAIFNLYGNWHETRSIVPALPIAIQEKVKDSEYSAWKISKLKERIEVPGWPDIYRFQVQMGKYSQIIRADIKGNIIQAKILNE